MSHSRSERGERVNSIKIGSQVQVRIPGWHTAGGEYVGPGRNHGLFGVVIDYADDYASADDRLYSVKFDGKQLKYPHWGSELKVISSEGKQLDLFGEVTKS